MKEGILKGKEMSIIKSLLVMGVLLLPYLAAAEGASSNRLFRVQVRELGVQSDPTPMAPVLTNLIYKTEVTITATNGNWYRVGDAGWVHRSGVTQRSLESSTGSVEEFSTIVSGVVNYLTTGVGNDKEPNRGDPKKNE